MNAKQLLTFAGALALATLHAPCWAHDPFEITTDGVVGADTMSLKVTLGLRTALLLSGADQPPRTANAEDFARHRPVLEAASVLLFEVERQGEALPIRHWDVHQGEPDEVTFSLRYDLPTPGRWRLVASHLAILPEGYTSVVKLMREPPQTGGPAKAWGFKVLHQDDPTLGVMVEAAPRRSNPAPGQTATVSVRSQLLRFFWLGIEHMLIGYDHLCFMAGVVLACRKLKEMLVVVTGFTLAHSLSLAASVLGMISLPASVVELLIAASIVYVAAENLLTQGLPQRRVLLSFTFGLIHGLGFASALRGAGIEQNSELMAALLSFNVGLEVSQVALAAAVLPIVLKMRAGRWGTGFIQAASVGILLFGSYWLITRVAALGA